MRLFLCGDVMTGRGIDQIMPYSCDPVLFERYVSSALDYVALAERISGPIPLRQPFGYVWGEALEAMDSRSPDLRIVNLETSITADGTPEAKGVNYRMHPQNVGCLTAAKIDCCVLANNHVGDWGLPALLKTERHLTEAGIATAGAGENDAAAARQAMLRTPSKGRVLVFWSGLRVRWCPAPLGRDRKRAGPLFSRRPRAPFRATACTGDRNMAAGRRYRRGFDPLGFELGSWNSRSTSPICPGPGG